MFWLDGHRQAELSGNQAGEQSVAEGGEGLTACVIGGDASLQGGCNLTE